MSNDHRAALEQMLGVVANVDNPDANVSLDAYHKAWNELLRLAEIGRRVEALQEAGLVSCRSASRSQRPVGQAGATGRSHRRRTP